MIIVEKGPVRPKAEFAMVPVGETFRDVSGDLLMKVQPVYQRAWKCDDPSRCWSRSPCVVKLVVNAVRLVDGEPVFVEAGAAVTPARTRVVVDG